MTSPARTDTPATTHQPDRPEGWGRWLPLAGFVLGSFAAAGIATAFQGGDIQQFYTQELTRPGWAPPAWLFGPVWSVMYLLIGVAAWRVWERAGWTRALTIWVIQLGFNAAWNPAFFNLRNVTVAAAVILILLGLIAWMIAEMAPIDRLAAWMMAPYIAWVGFASALTLAIWVLNPNLR